jgi:calcineurin-like phosphoesterase family protein
MHPQELRGKINVHGHMHRDAIQDPRYVNVNVDFTGMKPVLLDDIKSGKYTTYDKVPYEAERHR